MRELTVGGYQLFMFRIVELRFKWYFGVCNVGLVFSFRMIGVNIKVGDNDGSKILYC